MFVLNMSMHMYPTYFEIVSNYRKVARTPIFPSQIPQLLISCTSAFALYVPVYMVLFLLLGLFMNNPIENYRLDSYHP